MPKFLSMVIAALAVVLTMQMPSYAAPAPSKAADYCVTQGGVVQTRIPEYGTNGDDPLVLSGQADFCRFTSAKDGSQINLLLSTLYTEKPTLAALAYYAKVQLGGDCSGNPASCYCTQLGGSDLFGGIDAAGGGWVLKTDPEDVLETCIFPDLSTIDSWGLAYHSAGIIRGKNLAKVLRYADPYAARSKEHTPFRRS
jgi:putative hemolysin